MYISCQDGDCSLLHTALGDSPGAPDGLCAGPGRQVKEVIRLRKILGELILSKNTKGLLDWISRERPESRQ